jgi:catechol 2,3-dioxygenase-like lactoylglutathione lyase family enzyme
MELSVADPPDAWAAAGFAVDGDAVRIGDTLVRLVGRGPAGERGIRSWTIGGLDLPDGSLDGLPTRSASPAIGAEHAEGSKGARPDDAASSAHANGTTSIDHVVVLTPDLERTIEAYAAVGLDCRRIRETGSYGEPMRQAFFRLGPVIIEVVSGDVGIGAPAEDAPSSWFGLAVTVADLDETAAFLGEGLGSIKGAVQAGQRIATIRHKTYGMSVAVAAMDRHGDR